MPVDVVKEEEPAAELPIEEPKEDATQPGTHMVNEQTTEPAQEQGEVQSAVAEPGVTSGDVHQGVRSFGLTAEWLGCAQALAAALEENRRLLELQQH